MTEIEEKDDVKDIEKVVDTCFFDLNDIHEQSSGFREWLGKEQKSTYIPV